MEKRFHGLQFLRNNLEKARTILDQVKRREKAKLKIAEYRKNYIEILLQPVTYLLRFVIADLEKVDSKKIFAVPVSVDDVPDYYDIVKNPMDFMTLRARLENYQYQTFDEFRVYQVD